VASLLLPILASLNGFIPLRIRFDSCVFVLLHDEPMEARNYGEVFYATPGIGERA
jgi:hypothetical protein